MDAIGVKIECLTRTIVDRMVFLSELAGEWPWNGSPYPEYENKEIYTQIVPPSMTSDEWEIPISPPMPGYAYVGLRMAVAGKSDQYTVYPRFVLGKQRFPVLGHPWDIVACSNTKWTPLGFPLSKRVFTRGNLTLLLAHPSPSFGRIELLAQKFDDLLEDDDDISYAYYNPLTNRIEWLETNEHFYSGEQWITSAAPKRVKILHPVVSLLHKNMKKVNNETYQVGIQIENP